MNWKTACFCMFVMLVAVVWAQSNGTPASSTEAMYQAQAASAQRKLSYIQQNATQAMPDPRPTVFTENELNAYLNSGAVALPHGVSKVNMRGGDGTVHTRAQIDFEQVTGGERSTNPLMVLFKGVHQVDIAAHAVGIKSDGRVHVDSVVIDGVAVPRSALEYFINRYVKPKHPDLGLDSTFRLPERIDSAVVSPGNLTIRQQ